MSRFPCPRCHTLIAVSTLPAAGKPVACPHCGYIFAAPLQGASKTLTAEQLEGFSIVRGFAKTAPPPAPSAGRHPAADAAQPSSAFVFTAEDAAAAGTGARAVPWHTVDGYIRAFGDTVSLPGLHWRVPQLGERRAEAKLVNARPNAAKATPNVPMVFEVLDTPATAAPTFVFTVVADPKPAERTVEIIHTGTPQEHYWTLASMIALVILIVQLFYLFL